MSRIKREKLTIKQQEVMEYIISYWEENREFPKATLIAEHMDISLQMVYQYLLALQKKGWIAKMNNCFIIVNIAL